MGSLPLGAKTVGNFAQALDPTIYQRQRYVLFWALRFRDQDRLDAGHLSVVGGRRHAKENRLREAGENGEANDAEDEEEDLFWLVGMDAYKNHSIYGFYKQRSCHPLMPQNNSFCPQSALHLWDGSSVSMRSKLSRARAADRESVRSAGIWADSKAQTLCPAWGERGASWSTPVIHRFLGTCEFLSRARRRAG